MDALSGLEPFVFAARFRSYVKAGRHLGISSSAVAKSVSRLEARLGVQLLNRTTRSIGLTEAGAVFYERCREALEDHTGCRGDAASCKRRAVRTPARQCAPYRGTAPAHAAHCGFCEPLSGDRTRHRPGRQDCRSDRGRY
ncbi:LysR family transcriptional regulator [Komagataeibacter rhaeticus]